MRLGGNLPAYELFICRQTGEFLTYDRNRDKWLTAKLDLLDWPNYVGTSEKKWINPEGYSTIKTYLGVKHGGFSGLMEYQLKVRADELKRRHKRETDPWDLDFTRHRICQRTGCTGYVRWGFRKTISTTSTPEKLREPDTVLIVKKLCRSRPHGTIKRAMPVLLA